MPLRVKVCGCGELGTGRGGAGFSLLIFNREILEIREIRTNEFSGLIFVYFAWFAVNEFHSCGGAGAGLLIWSAAHVAAFKAQTCPHSPRKLQFAGFWQTATKRSLTNCQNL
jgi:hypothetical protein